MGVPILQYLLPQQFDAGIRQEVIPGLVSEYECRETARFVLCSWEHWLDWDESSRASACAHFRVNHALEANVSDAHSRYMDKLSRRRRNR